MNQFHRSMKSRHISAIIANVFASNAKTIIVMFKHVRMKPFSYKVLLIRCFPADWCIDQYPRPTWGWYGLSKSILSELAHSNLLYWPTIEHCKRSLCHAQERGGAYIVKSHRQFIRENPFPFQVLLKPRKNITKETIIKCPKFEP